MPIRQGQQIIGVMGDFQHGIEVWQSGCSGKGKTAPRFFPYIWVQFYANMNTLEKFHDIRTFIFDVDGVMTDGLVHVLDDGSLLRNMHVRDAYAIRRAVEKGYRIIVITAGKSMGVRLRLEELGIREIYADIRDKLAVLTDLVVHHGLDLGESLYMGDDLPDYQAMCKVHFPVCPADAVREIIGISQYVSPYRGGGGCVREVIEKVLTLHGHWFSPKAGLAVHGS